jgi:ABC-type phosphate transport system substrate-binding protein
LSREQVVRYFLKKATAWPSGKVVAPVDQEKDSAARAAFSQGVLHKSVAEVIAYWQQQIFSGKDVPLPEKPSDGEVMAFVQANPNAIGYISADTAPARVKVVTVTE